MNSRSGHSFKILDSATLIDYVQSNNLKEFLVGLSKKHHVLIPVHVRNETKNRLMSMYSNPDKATYFEKTLKELSTSQEIDTHHKHSILEKPFKELVEHLKHGSPRVERVDRNVVALACQLGAHICSKDPGIARAINKIKTARVFRSWRRYADSIELQKP
jgi:hypothetical protein